MASGAVKAGGNWMLPLSDLDIAEKEVDAVAAVLRSRWLSQGAVTGEFEAWFGGCAVRRGGDA